MSKTPENHFTKTAKDYARRVLNGKQPACLQVRQAAQRFLDDFKRKDIVYSEKAALHACEFISNLVHVKGKWAGQRITLEPFQVFALVNIFGWLNKATGYRRYREAMIFLPRKNGKSLLAAGIALYMTFADGEPGAEGYSGATSLAQANEVFSPAKAMAEMTPELGEALDIETAARSVYSTTSRSRLTPVIAKTKDGASPHVAVCDELHQAIDDTQITAFRTGMGARSQPLLLVITTAGTNLAGICRTEQLEAEAVLAGTKLNDRLFALIYTIDPEDDWRQLSSFKKANPNYGVSVSEEYLKNALEQALQSPSKQASVRTKHLNQWVASASGWLSAHTWTSAADPKLEITDYYGRDAFLAIDKATRQDLTALSLIVPDDDRYLIFPFAHLPTGALDTSPNASSYREWIADGYLEQTPGTASDFLEVEHLALELCKNFRIKKAIVDPWQSEGTRQKIAALGIDAETWPSYSPALWTRTMDDFEAALKNGKIVHPDHPVLNWCAMNVAVHEKGVTRTPVKPQKDQKIDVMIATMMAFGIASEEPMKKGETFFFFA